MKRLLSFVITLALLLALSVSALAIDDAVIEDFKHIVSTTDTETLLALKDTLDTELKKKVRYNLLQGVYNSRDDIPDGGLDVRVVPGKDGSIQTATIDYHPHSLGWDSELHFEITSDMNGVRIPKMDIDRDYFIVINGADLVATSVFLED